MVFKSSCIIKMMNAVRTLKCWLSSYRGVNTLHISSVQLYWSELDELGVGQVRQARQIRLVRQIGHVGPVGQVGQVGQVWMGWMLDESWMSWMGWMLDESWMSWMTQSSMMDRHNNVIVKHKKT
jgi:hypothetical protein